jgi:co-chaperonin GroES (HSP10)
MKEIFEPLGPRIKVKVAAPREERSAGGIIMQLGDKEEDNETGIVVALGEYAYGNFKENWVDVGDIVLFQRYAGKPREEIEKDGSIGYYRILKDVDVIARLKTEEKEHE